MFINKWRKSQAVIKRYYVIGILFTIVLGTLLQYTYKWSDKNMIIAMFSVTSGSVWEHLKKLFIPMFLYTIYGYLRLGNHCSNFLYVMAMGVICTMAVNITAFYTYTGIIGKTYPIIDALVFIFSILIGFGISFQCLHTYKITADEYYENESIGAVVLLILFFLFITFTFKIPYLNLFHDVSKN